MLSGLYVRDFAIVRQLELTTKSGFTVLTGETGAGKSILVDALAQVLGARTDTGAIRQGCNQAEVVATFELAPDHHASRWLKDNELDADQDCVVRRLLIHDKATKAFINGRPVPLQMLRELGTQLVDIHGQHEHQSLLRQAIQREVLDDYADLAASIQKLGNYFHKIRELGARLERLSNESSSRQAHVDLLRHHCEELSALDPQSNEFEELGEEHKRLAHAVELVDGIQFAAHALYDADEDSASQTLAKVTRRLETLTEYDSRLVDITSLIKEATLRLDDAAAQLRHHRAGTELDPGRLEWVEQRLGQLHDLARKHRVEVAGLVEFKRKLDDELASLDDVDSDLDHLKLELNSLQDNYSTLAQTLSKRRQSAAKVFSRKVTEQMQGLGMAGGQFMVKLTPTPTPTAHGLDGIEFYVSTNPTQPTGPLSKVASGGELSRISLAVQVVSAGVGRIPTLIFDEVDVGIGGGVAEIVGHRLRSLGSSRQVLCITHLPQVASQGNHHMRVVKHSDQDVDVIISPLGEAERVTEIARMLGGLEVTDQSLAHAEQMLERATG